MCEAGVLKRLGIAIRHDRPRCRNHQIHGTHRHSQVGHRNYGKDPAITEQVDALIHAIDRLGLTNGLVYMVVIVSG